MSWSLQGRTVLITGAARGIGAESARRIAARGANVALVGLEPEELERVATQCGTNAAWFEADVTDLGSLERAVEGAVERFGGIDVVMANAGIAAAGFVRTIDPAAFERTIEVNVLGVWRTVRACLPHVIERRGYVLVVSSSSAIFHAPGLAPYVMSKAGVEAFSDSLRGEVAHLGVGVGVGYFHWIDTDMVRGADAHPTVEGFRERASGPLNKTYSVASVGKAVADGIEARKRHIVVPNWLHAAIAVRGLLQPLIDRQAKIAVPEVDAAFERDVAERGAAAVSAPVGAGGQADPKLGQPIDSTAPAETVAAE
jgi:NAD(P)-dependent dehydrogenase (short-subunit alcohol dehydrogenase family)